MRAHFTYCTQSLMYTALIVPWVPVLKYIPINFAALFLVILVEIEMASGEETLLRPAEVVCCPFPWRSSFGEQNS